MRVSVVIPAWNLWNFTSSCLESLARTAPSGSIEVIVVDNGSTDETATDLQELGARLFGKNFQRLRLEENLGFAKGCNLGAGAATGDLIFFLNNDTVALPGWLDPLVEVFQNPRVGAAGPLLLYPDDTVQHCGIYFDPFFRVGHLYQHFPADHPLASRSRRLQAITGGAIMVPARLFRELDGFFEGFKNGFEDLDLCCRLLDAGYRLELAPKSRIYHYESQTPGRFTHDLQNSDLIKTRLSPRLWPDLHIFANMDGYSLKVLPDLSTSLQVSDARKRELSDLTANTGVDKLGLALEKEPLWREGWKTLVKRLADMGKPEQALAFGKKAMFMFSDLPLALQMLEVVRKNSSREECRAMLPFIEEVIRLISQPVPEESARSSREMVKSVRRAAWKKGDKLLAGILDDWLVGN